MDTRPATRNRLRLLWLGTHDTSDPERPTLLERLIDAVPLPYVPAGLLIAALVSAPSRVLMRMLHGYDFQNALTAVFAAGEPATTAQILGSIVLWFGITFYAIWVTRYLRMKVRLAEPKLAPLLPAGATTYQAVFARVTRDRPALLLGLVLAVTFTGDTLARLRTAAGPVDWVYQAAITPIMYLIFGTAIWAYVSATWSLYRLGQEPLKLKSPADDAMLGARPMGSLSLALSFAGFGQVALMTLVFFVSPVLPAFQVLLIALAVIGVVMFFLPLNGVHHQMEAEKKHQEAAFRRRVFGLLEGDPVRGDAGTPEPLADTLAELRNVLALHTARPAVAAIPTWPVDTGMLRRLGAVAGSIIVAVITNIVLNLLQV